MALESQGQVQSEEVNPVKPKFPIFALLAALAGAIAFVIAFPTLPFASIDFIILPRFLNYIGFVYSIAIYLRPSVILTIILLIISRARKEGGGLLAVTALVLAILAFVINLRLWL